MGKKIALNRISHFCKFSTTNNLKFILPRVIFINSFSIKITIWSNFKSVEKSSYRVEISVQSGNQLMRISGGCFGEIGDWIRGVSFSACALLEICYEASDFIQCAYS
jgi:hypothetical protein